MSIWECIKFPNDFIVVNNNVFTIVIGGYFLNVGVEVFHQRFVIRLHLFGFWVVLCSASLAVVAVEFEFLADCVQSLHDDGVGGVELAEIAEAMNTAKVIKGLRVPFL